MTFLQLQQRLARRRGANTTFVTATQTRYQDAINEAHRAVLRQPWATPLRYGQVTVASVASQKLYSLPTQGVARINRITETTNDRKLEYRTPEWLDTVDPDPQTGTPWAWIPRGFAEVHTQPSNASEIFAKSTSAADNTQTIYIEGIITGGYYRTASVALNGTTAASLSATITTFIFITKCYLSAAGVGTITLHEDSGVGTELSRIAIGDTRAQFLTFQLYNTPSGVDTFYVDILRQIPDMSNNTDEPLLPEDWHDLLIDKAELKELRKADDPNRYSMLVQDIKQAEASLRTFIVAHPDWHPFDEEPYQRSRLGAWFPADLEIG